MHPSFARSEGLTYTVMLQIKHAHTSSCARQSTHGHAHTNTNNMKVTVQTNFGLVVRFSLIFQAEFFIITQRLLHRLCQIIASFLHFSRENESIPWKLSSRAGLCNPERQALAKTLASDPGNGLVRIMPDLNVYTAMTRSPKLSHVRLRCVDPAETLGLSLPS